MKHTCSIESIFWSRPKMENKQIDTICGYSDSVSTFLLKSNINQSQHKWAVLQCRHEEQTDRIDCPLATYSQHWEHYHSKYPMNGNLWLNLCRHSPLWKRNLEQAQSNQQSDCTWAEFLWILNTELFGSRNHQAERRDNGNTKLNNQTTWECKKVFKSNRW